MQKRAQSLRFGASREPGVLPVAELGRWVEEWLLDCQIRQHSKGTIEARRGYLRRLEIYLRDHRHESMGVPELRRFFVWLGATGIRPTTVATYHRAVRTFSRWLVSEGILGEAAMDGVPTPVHRANQIEPLSQDQVRLLLEEARRGLYPLRNVAIVLMLLDTGLRATELCNLKMSAVDLSTHKAIVMGKGNKSRAVYFGNRTSRALMLYLRTQDRHEDEYLFLAESGPNMGGPLTRSGLLQLISEMGHRAGIRGVRCSPHTLRHTFAVEFLRNQGNTFALQQLLGHTNVQMTQRYVSFAQADLENQHRNASPMDRMAKL